MKPISRSKWAVVMHGHEENTIDVDSIHNSQEKANKRCAELAREEERRVAKMPPHEDAPLYTSFHSCLIKPVEL